MSKKKPAFYEIIMIVEGRGTFPLDMLRYDTCMPRTEVDTHAIEHSGPRRVTLRRFCKPGMTEDGGKARWASFGWHIISIQPVEP